jgi:hypothetical protein
MTPGSRTVFIDVLFVLLMVLVLLPHNPETESKHTPPGSVIVEIRWPDGLDTDVDLWVQAPGDDPVGYSRRAGEYFNLLRDDLGSARDALELNYENAYSRGMPVGEYIVNLHLYASRSPLPVSVAVQVSRATNTDTLLVFARTVELVRIGQQITVNRFTLNEHGVVQGSINDLPKALR